MTAKDLLVPLQDRTLSGSVWKVVICPRMDLVAVVLDRNSIAVFRTNWQRLATIPVCSAQNEVITCVAWSSDGANIVVGTSSLILAVYSVDRCASTSTVRAKRGSREAEPIVTRKLLAAPTSLLWSTTPSTPSSKDKNKRFAAYENRIEKIHQPKPSTQDETCDGLLLVGDADGMMTILTHNLLLSIARIPAVPNGFAVDHIHLTASQRYCLTSGSNAPADKEPSHEIAGDTRRVLQAFDLTPILDYWPEIDSLGREAVNFTSLVDKLSAAVQRVRQGWIEGALEVLTSTIKTPLETLMTRFAEDGDSAWQALHDVYCGARIKGAVLQFLANDLSENGAKEALRSFRNHADDTEEVLFSIIPIAENTVFSSSEYRGLSRLESRFKPVGVVFSEAEKLFNASEKLLWVLGDLVGEIEQVSQEAEAFLAWLVTAAAKAGGESVQARGPALADSISGRDAEMISKFFAKHSNREQADGQNAARVVTTLISDKVEPALEAFKKCVDAIVTKPCDVISAGLERTDEISFSNRHEGDIPSTYSSFKTTSEKSDTHDVNVIQSIDNGSFVRIRYDFGNAKWTVRRYCLQRMGLKVQSAVMLSSNAVLAVTIENKSTEGEERYKCDVSLYELDSDDFDVDSMIEDSKTDDANVQTIALPDATDLSGKQLDSKPCGSIRQRGDAALSVNTQLGLASVVAAPRKIFLFQTPYRSLPEEDDV